MTIDDLIAGWSREPDWPAGAVMWRKVRRDPDTFAITSNEQEAKGWCEKGHHDIEALFPESFVRALLSAGGEG